MFVCVCNGLCEKDVDSAIAEGAVNVPEVHRTFNCTAKCGMCVPEIEDRIFSHLVCSAPIAAAQQLGKK